jgi:hemoglobin-like flavoprotein
MTEKVNRFDGLMKGVAQSHREMKVRRSDFFAFGESTLKALSDVLGNEVYSQEMEQSWLRMYSVMIRAILKEYPEQLDNLEEEMSEFENISYCCNITPPSRDAIPHSSSQRARKLVSVTSA